MEVLYRSAGYLIVNKPYDVYINSNDDTEKNTVEHQLNADDRLSCRFVHRLDYATSGVICLALTKTAAAVAGRLFENRSVEKYYLAIVRGHVQFEIADVNIAIGYDANHADDTKQMCADMNTTCLKARSARTRILVISKGSYRNEDVTKILLKPITGRRHQLRVHCCIIGHTILGDYTYSNKKDSETYRMFLHALRLKLPIKNEPIDIMTEDPYSSDDRFSEHWQCKDEGIDTWEQLFHKINMDKPDSLIEFNKNDIINKDNKITWR